MQSAQTLNTQHREADIHPSDPKGAAAGTQVNRAPTTAQIATPIQQWPDQRPAREHWH